ncbi:MAG: efflux RND transporter periplasmic adaptor subunit [Phycisphaerae bacterium]|nr:efflux RND transporter periplasmic adaptor subunit [Phycisphaerae bacterium]
MNDNYTSPSPVPHLSGWGKAKRFLQILNVRLRFVFLMVIVGLVASKWETIVNYYDRYTRPAAATATAVDESIEYYCPMHPKIIKDTPGSCPICGMPLSKRVKSSGPTTSPEGVLAQVQMTPLKVRLGRIATTQVEYRLLGREVRTIGQIDYAEPLRTVITARIKGRLDKLWVNYTGQKVNEGDKLAEIYSPDLLVAQEELLLAARAAKGADNDLAGQSARSLLAAARKKLILWGITDRQIDKIIEDGLRPGGKVSDRMEILSPMTGLVTEKKVLEGQYVMDGQELYTVADLGLVWMQADIYEQDIAGIGQGLAVAVEADAYPNESFPGRITFIAFKVEPETRTIKARIEILNPEYKLKPGMNVVARIGIPAGLVVEATPSSQPESAASANTHGIVHAYLPVSAALAADKIDAAAATKLAAEADGLATQLSDAKPIADAARKMAGSKDLTSQRDVFRTMSEQLITLLRTHPPDGMTLFVVNCPMAGTGGNWVAAKDEVVNPYQGSGMLNCGSVVESPMRVTQAGPGAAVRFTPDGQYAYGYYCPIYPDQLFGRPEQCPISKLPFRYVKAQRVLAVPESAVIDTGERQVVYRETSPGSFEMIQVKIGERAGEFYPVLDGLKLGDRVVTRGAFAVDAENRLNPAASVQYQGAQGGPKKEHPHP